MRQLLRSPSGRVRQVPFLRFWRDGKLSFHAVFPSLLSVRRPVPHGYHWGSHDHVCWPAFFQGRDSLVPVRDDLVGSSDSVL